MAYTDGIINYSINISWDKLGDDAKKAYTQRFLDDLFDGQMHLYTADLNGWQMPVKRLVKIQAGEVNQFFTPNAMKKRKGHSRAATLYISHIKLDLDLKNTDRFRDKPSYAWDHILEYISYKLWPSAVINSGHGLHLYWFLNRGISKEGGEALSKKIVSRLCEIYKEYAPDWSTSSDISRVLRLPMTLNAKKDKETGHYMPIKEVKLMALRDRKYCIEELAQLTLGEDWDGSQSPATQKQLEQIARMEEVLGEIFPDRYKASKKAASKTLNMHQKAYKEKLAKKPTKPISEAQISYIQKICSGMDLPFPAELKTTKDGQAWIANHRNEYGRYVEAQKASNSLVKTFVQKSGGVQYAPKTEEEFQEDTAIAFFESDTKVEEEKPKPARRRGRKRKTSK